MSRPHSLARVALIGLGLGLVAPVLAHTTQVAGDVAGTWHVEPDHNPRAGEPTTAWVVLTQAGGTLLPFEQTQCTLQVYALPRRPEDAPILEPPVKAIAAEQYNGIPGADLVFPQPGRYDLELACTPTQATFTPFTLTYEVAVAAGNPQTPPPASPSPSASPNPEAIAPPSTPTPPSRSPWGRLNGAIALLTVVGVGAWLWRTRR